MKDLLIRQIDKQITPIKRFARLERPPHGWIKTIREALGMSLPQAAKRVKMSPQGLQQLEKTEGANTITLASLKKVAAGMNCRLFYVLIPEAPLEETVEKQIRKKAESLVKRTSHSMGLEDQGTDPAEQEYQILKIIEDIKRRKNISLIWEEDSE